ncbi:MAG: hypothetical protein HYZ81_15690 [Nitrospinae bacterium]|nr:hypothetical protein [Nitrospinota bacterium]
MKKTSKQVTVIPLVLAMFLIQLLVGCGSGSSGVQALFHLDSPTGGPFPSDRFTVPDPSHNTGLRVNLSTPDCSVRPSDCQNLDVINTLDGFNLQPQLSIPFDGAIDVETVTGNTVFLISLGSTLRRGDRGGQVIGINQVVWDTFTNTLHVESDELLDQHTRYALIVTRGVRDRSGNPVESTEAFRRFRQVVQGDYKQALLDAIAAAGEAGVPEREIVTASVFTTQSVTTILEKIRDQIKGATFAAPDFNLGPGGTRTVFRLSDITGITVNQQTGDNPPRFTPVQVNLAQLAIIPGAVGQIAHGKYLSPDYQVHPGEFMPPVGTHTGTPEVQRINEIYFTLFLPSSPMPEDGWPVAMFGTGGLASKDTAPFSVAATMTAHGFATISINIVGHGFGPLGTLRVNRTGGEPVTLSAGGRGIDRNGDGVIGANEGVAAAAPRSIIGDRDGKRQTVVDLLQLVRAIEVGMDVDGDGFPDLDPSRISYFGASFGGFYGTVFLAIEPHVRVGALTVAGGALDERNRLTPANRPGIGRGLAARVPSLLNAPEITSIGGVAVAPPQFNENKPLRDGVPLVVRLADGTSQVIQSPVTNTVVGAMDIQEVIENTEWVRLSGDPVAYASHIRKAPLAGMPAKSVLFQFAKGDRTVHNPSTTALLRAGDLADRATYYRHDLAFAENPARPKDPHGFQGAITDPTMLEIALGAQAQIAVFFASDGQEIIHPEPARFFEVPIAGPLPEDLNFIP